MENKKTEKTHPAQYKHHNNIKRHQKSKKKKDRSQNFTFGTANGETINGNVKPTALADSNRNNSPSRNENDKQMDPRMRQENSGIENNGENSSADSNYHRLLAGLNNNVVNHNNSAEATLSGLAVCENAMEGSDSKSFCSYCKIKFGSPADLLLHCRTQEHQTMIMSDEGGNWKYRPPPRGVAADEYNLCTTFIETSSCRLGEQCIDAHSQEELEEWRHRFEYRAMKLEKARENQLHGASYADQLLEKLSQGHNQNIITEKVSQIVYSVFISF